MLKRTLALALALGSAAALAQEIAPGQWRFTSTVSSPTLPKPQASSYSLCLKKTDGTNPARWLGKQDPDCKVRPVRTTGESFRWEMACAKSGLRGSGEVQLGGDSMQSELRMTGEAQGKKIELLTSTSGRRVGPCKS